MIEYKPETTEEVWMLGHFPPERLLEHFNSCEGCCTCDQMMNIYGQCFCCDIIIDKGEMYYDHPDGNYYCESCVDKMPDKNTAEFIRCGFCGIRDYKVKMVEYHCNFDTPWVCDKCVSESAIESRFDIL